MLSRCLEVLREERAAAEGRDRCERLKPFLAGDEASASYAAGDRDLGLGESAVRVAVHRLRRRFCDVLRAEVGRTVRSPADVDAEIRWMLEVVRANQ